VAFYFRFQGAIPNVTTFQLIIHDHTGAAYFTGQVHRFTTVAGEHMTTMNNNGAYPTGTYSVALLVDGHVAASASFTVGVPVPRPSGVTVSAFYVAVDSAAAINAMINKNVLPPLTHHFPAGTVTILAIFAFDHARPSQMAEVRIYAANGAIAAVYPATKLDGTGGTTGDQVLHKGGPFPPGAYRAALLIDGVVMRSTSFTVGP
jgi:hypothetical protein